MTPMRRRRRRGYGCGPRTRPGDLAPDQPRRLTITLDRPERAQRAQQPVLPRSWRRFEQAASDDSAGRGADRRAGTRSARAPTSPARSRSGEASTRRAPAAVARCSRRCSTARSRSSARVQGHVAGGGNGLVAACDLAVAVEGARFAFSRGPRRRRAGGDLGRSACADDAAGDAAELMLTGERVSAERVRDGGAAAPRSSRSPRSTRPCGLIVDALLLGGPEAAGDEGAAASGPGDVPRRGVRLDRGALGAALRHGGARGDDRLRRAPPTLLGPPPNRPPVNRRKVTFSRLQSRFRHLHS